MSHSDRVPSTPRVISPSPTPSERSDGNGGYFAPTTRSAAKRVNSSRTISEEQETDSESGRRARAKSRESSRLQRRGSGAVTTKARADSAVVQESKPLVVPSVPNGHLSPASAATSYWRQLSRSPSPRLIPIHKSWRSFVHRHEIPRKILHVSIGFFTLHLYARGLQTSSIHPWLLGAVIPIASVDVLRHNFAGFNRLYVRALGAFMRESEVNDKYNGVIFYLLGAWISMRFFPKDVGVVSILLLSWCDTAASTIGRLYGRYTPQVRKGKSLAGSAAAAFVGTITSALFLGIVVPYCYGYEEQFMYKGYLSFPGALGQLFGLNDDSQIRCSGWLALSVMSIWSGLAASASEMVDLFGLDDNLTIPVLSGLGIWGFLKTFG